MQTLADAVIVIVNRLDGVDGRIVHALPAEAYAAPGRTRFNHSLRASADKVSNSAHRLTHLAATLTRGAEDLRSAQIGWDAAERDRKDREAVDAARAAAARRR